MLYAILFILLMVPIYFGWVVLLLPIIFIPLSFFVFVLVYPIISFRVVKAILKHDLQVLNIKVIDDSSMVVNFSDYFPGLLLGKTKNNNIRGRYLVGEMLMQAQEKLPTGYKLMINECYRSADTERKYQDDCIKEFKLKDILPSKEKIAQEYDRLTQEYDHNGHHTGGVLDVTLVDDKGSVVDMGPHVPSGLNWLGAVQKIKLETKECSSNRKKIFQALEQTGFICYPTEWWHWSFGDRYWCFKTKSHSAIYGDIVA
jgi:D-alanyl-D-alanine dipeptidase